MEHSVFRRRTRAGIKSLSLHAGTASPLLAGACHTASGPSGDRLCAKSAFGADTARVWDGSPHPGIYMLTYPHVLLAVSFRCWPSLLPAKVTLFQGIRQRQP